MPLAAAPDATDAAGNQAAVLVFMACLSVLHMWRDRHDRSEQQRHEKQYGGE
jgi:hypothetical protein